MNVAVIRFPGANCDQDAYFSLRDDLGLDAEYVWHEESSLAGFDAVFLPGGFSYGDYLRCGAMASRAPIMAEVRQFAAEGRPIDRRLQRVSSSLRGWTTPRSAPFECRPKVHLQRHLSRAVENRTSIWTQGVDRTYLHEAEVDDQNRVIDGVNGDVGHFC